jgi:hypothetical protein
MLKELKVLLELFEWVTDEFQANDVTISRVFPAVITLRTRLSENSNECIYTQKIRNDLLASLNKSFPT